MKSFVKKIFAVTSVVVCLVCSLSAQITTGELSGKQVNTITTAVPFLLITPDSRAGGMGDVGAASSPDANSIHWNPAKLAVVDKRMGLSISYTPWLHALVPDIRLMYLSGYYKLKKDQTIATSMRYFSLGDITFTDINGTNTGQFRPNEFALDFAYARKLATNWSGGMALRYLNSNLTGGITVQGSATHPGRTVAADISTFYNKKDIKVGGKKSAATAGIVISNIGAKISYSDKKDRDFIPINLRLGSGLTIELDDYNSVSFIGEINKLLVPTPPIYATESNGAPVLNADGSQTVLAGKDPDRGVAEGMFGSFSDAPGKPLKNEDGEYIYTNSDSSAVEIQKGSVFKEELREFNYSIGMEYWYDKQFAFRFGYYHEDATKGNRKFFTIGAGLKYNVFGLDFAYLIPTSQRHPLANTLRFTLLFDFEAFKSQNKEKEPEAQPEYLIPDSK